MKKFLLLIIALVFTFLPSAFSQTQKTGVGIGIYPTGTETGFGFRSAKDKPWVVDVRMTRANFFIQPKAGSFINEASVLYRVAYYEKVRLHVGVGARIDWNFSTTTKAGMVVPVGVEAFPFPFQNAGLFFEAAPYLMFAGLNGQYNIGIRTVAGFVFYFPVKEEKK